MRYSTTAIILAAMTVGEAVAGPTHVHRHRKAHEKKSPDVDWSALDWEAMDINWTSAWAAGQASKTAAAATEETTAPASTPTSTVAAAEVTTSATSEIAHAAAAIKTSTTSSAKAAATSSESIIDDLEDLWDSLVGASNSRTSFGSIITAEGSTGDNYYGNYGSPYGSNVIKTSASGSHSYTAEFVNTQSKTITVNIWNKVGPDMEVLSGSALAPKNTTLTFALKAGASQVVAFDENSQIAFAEATNSIAASGAYAATWGECNFVKTGSGYDMSAIMNPNGNNYNMTITSSEAPDCTSDPTQNYWLTATEPIGNSDGSCFISQSTATLKVIMGGEM